MAEAVRDDGTRCAAPAPDRGPVREDAAAREEAALLGAAPVEPERTTRYGPHPDQLVDWYGPDGPGPLVVLVHGGFWRAAYDRAHLSPLAADLAGRGLRVALVEFRRVGSGGGWPVTCDDVTAAVTAAAGEQRTAAAAGAGRPAGAGEGRAGCAPVLLAGHSSGGHLVLRAAARALPVDHVLALAPVADLRDAHARGLSDGAVAGFCGPGGGLAARIDEADPVHHPPRGVPVTVLHGTRDAEVPPELSHRYVAAVARTRAGTPHPPCVLRELAGVGHYAPITPGTPAHRVLLDTVGAALGTPV